MKFYFEKITLWLENGKIREIEFLPNKINVITGKSNKGKTSILDIIDYCLFAGKSKIPESIINENVAWYGLKFHINNQCYAIARKKPIKGKSSSEYYFSPTGDTPKNPSENNSEATIKEILEVEFGIDRNVTIPYGGKQLKLGSKISLRYFLLFNTISQDIISNSQVFFDKQEQDRYREALPRIFDMAVGIDVIENILKREKKTELEGQLSKLKQKSDNFQKKKSEFHSELIELIKRAKEFGLISPEEDIDNSIDKLQEIIESRHDTMEYGFSEKYRSLKTETYLKNRKIINLQRFSKEYEAYKSSLENISDSLKPILYLTSNNPDIIKTDFFTQIITSLSNDFHEIKQAAQKRTPINIKVNDIIKKYEKEVAALNEQISQLPDEARSFSGEKEKFIFIGEVKAKLDLYTKKSKATNSQFDDEIDVINDYLSELDVLENSEQKNIILRLIEEVISEYINITKEALDNYKDYKPIFNYKDKKLELRKPRTDFIEPIGSSSNHMFMHLFLFLGLHEVILQQNVPHVPSFLIIDQPSRPYWGENTPDKDTLVQSDQSKMKLVFKLLDEFMNNIINKMEKEHQIIVFEHVPSEIWKGLKNVHLVEEFIGDNALIPNITTD